MGRMIFRKVALERLSSPEQLDQLMTVTRPAGWVGLAALFLLLTAAVVWGFAGSIPTEALGEGILLRQGGVSDLVAVDGGQVDEVLVEVGDLVGKGEVVARLRQEEVERQIDDARARLTDAREELASLMVFAAEQRRLRARNRDQRRANLRNSIDALEREVELLEERVAAESELLAEGLITKQALLATEQELTGKRERLASQELELDGLEITRLETEQELEQRITVQEAAVRDQELQVRELRARLQESSRVVSPYAGRLLELMVDRGDVVNPGTPLMTLEIQTEELVAVLFVPAEQGKQVQPGMEARIAPSTVKREEHGFMLGTVRWVAEYPSTARGMRRLLSNDELVARLLEQGPPIQVDVELLRDPGDPDAYLWSSSSGPDLEISSGTLASGSVVVREQKPIRLVVPAAREKLGI